MKLKFYMKSGNQLTQNGIREYKITNKGNEVVGVSIQYSWWKRIARKLKINNCLILGGVNLEQIEAVEKL